MANRILMPTVYLIPSLLHEEGINAIPYYIIDAVKNCQVFFVENERTARRYLKKLWKEIVIDNYEWYTVSDTSQVSDTFKQKIKEGKNIGIISEAGCPGVADPGQVLVAIAQEMNVEVKPLVGPNSILLALMASGMNGQQFRFCGYLPIDNHERSKAIKELEAESKKKNCTQIFIETPYRNNQMLEALLKNCNAATRLCVAVDLTGKTEWIKTKTIADWSKGLLSEKKEKVDIHKRLAIFLILAE
jgi:16S rRNA (cytidine1402-2'-O)-methyltransferase